VAAKAASVNLENRAWLLVGWAVASRVQPLGRLSL